MIINNDTVAKQQSVDLSNYVKFRLANYNNASFACCNNSTTGVNTNSSAMNLTNISTYPINKTATSGREFVYPNVCYFSICYNTSYINNAYSTNSYNQRILIIALMYGYTFIQHCLCFVNGQISTKYNISNLSYSSTNHNVTFNCNLSNIYNHRYIATAIFSDYGS